MSFAGRHVQRTWHLIDATGQTVGRLANTIAPILRGKHKPTFRPDGDCGDYVVVINAEKVHFSGKKWQQKLYRWHTGYPGGLKERKACDVLERKPEDILRKAVMGMLYRNNLRHQYIEKRLRLFTGPDHPHLSQLPVDVTPLPKHPRKRSGDYHFGFPDGKYAPDGVSIASTNDEL